MPVRRAKNKKTKNKKRSKFAISCRLYCRYDTGMKLFAVMILCLVASSAFAVDTAYFSALRELPVASGLTEDRQSAVRFDQPEGRIIVLQASGRQTASEIQGFYSNTLPALGWKNLGGNRYARKGEILSLEVKPLQQGWNRANILLQPQ